MSAISFAQEALKKFFGYDAFRPMQESIIQSIYEGEDALVLMPTGGGKSMCFQIPAITLPGTCLVVSPLISLMKDQVEGLIGNGVRAAFLNSSLSPADTKKTEDQLLKGELDLLYVSPERLSAASFISLLKHTQINLIAIDEAHCISAWGHDFRPEYTQLGFLRKQFAKVPVIALTATADQLTRQDIIKQLALENPQVFLASFDRPNLSLSVKPGQKRYEQIFRFIQQRSEQAGIVYCLSRKSTEQLSARLSKAGFNAKAYHAGLSSKERSRVQSEFINDQTTIVCATIAFGMGIDKSNVRWVIHYNLPKNLESFYQEIGRAGRDGVKADTLLFYSFQDIMVLRDILGDGNSAQTQLQLAKLDRMQQYAEAIACRRRLLLSYFDEDVENNCGNCDNCINPPAFFDGTIIAQKALSAIYRLEQKVPMGLLIDVLRGSSKQEVLEKGYQHIKTYGAGRDIPYSHWQQYLLQLMNLGYLDIAYLEKNRVRLKPSSRLVLSGNQKVELVQPAVIRQRKEKAEKTAKSKQKAIKLEEDLFQLLRQVRKRLAQEFGIPPYQIFSDATLIQMSNDQPLNDEQLLQVSGVGERKLQRYGDAFLDVIQDFSNRKTSTEKVSTYEASLALFKEGLSVEEIAIKRSLNQATIFTHLAYLFEHGYPVDISSYIQEKEIDTISKAFKYVAQPPKLKDVYEYFSEQHSYHKIRLAQAYLKREQKS